MLYIKIYIEVFFMSSFLVKKSLVLSDPERTSKKAVLSIEGNGADVVGRVRLYNFSALPQGILTLGIYSNGKVYKAGLTHKEGGLYTFLSNAEPFSNDFSCAVINVYNGDAKPILFGSIQGKSEGLDEVVNAVKKAENMGQVEEILDEYGVDYNDEEKAEIEKAIDQEFCAKCENCKYKQYFYSVDFATKSSAGERKEQLLKKQDDEQNQNDCQTFYQELKPQIDKLFAENKKESYLESIFPDSKWVKVSLDGDDYYVFGLIMEEGRVKYICYGVPGVYQKNPPRELSGNPCWLALDSENKEGFGYWLTYQDAENGESIKMVVE